MRYMHIMGIDEARIPVGIWSWAITFGTHEYIVERSSGQFIYAATVMRFI